ncbi:hypothetical protein BCR44DRAFT_47509 [Catenaria anguillulae PL171]|uniref:BTB domain-containing protein n=1 Tax=Catenaria anguillulae PL171 TaxID=765915 RepID=A0A1Y2HX98_9FUNG|nr:hypothetical protein BCR44DRAFT_47509 [Catenaria anguillulae PL171]
MATIQQSHLCLVTTNHVDFSRARTLTLSLGRVKCKWGILDFELTRWGPYTEDKDTVDVCMTVDACTVPAGAPPPTKITIQLDCTHHAIINNAKPGAGGSRSEAREEGMCFGPQSQFLTGFYKGYVARVTFPLDPIFFKRNVVLDQLSVTVEAPLDRTLTAHNDPSRFPFPQALVDTINVPALCDCTFALGDGTTLRASRAILAHASPSFFGTMFGRQAWTAGGRDSTIQFRGWSIKAYLPCMVHMYSGWIPDEGPLTVPVAVEHGLDTNEFLFADWLQVMRLAEMLELPELAGAARRAMVKALLNA